MMDWFDKLLDTAATIAVGQQEVKKAEADAEASVLNTVETGQAVSTESKPADVQRAGFQIPATVAGIKTEYVLLGGIGLVLLLRR